MGRPETVAEGLPVVLDPAHEAIRRAEAGIREGIRLAEKDAARPVCHFRPPARWMNDPNGTLFHDGWYHLFYQLNPFGEEWGEVHWGHARSRDLVRWEHLPVALAPTPEAGEGHCFSGCGWTDATGLPVFFYTSWPPGGDGPPGGGGRAAQQWIVRADAGLRRFEKPAANPILEIGRDGVPAFRPDWRDPFVFEDEGRTFMVVGAALGDDVAARGPDAEAAAEGGEAFIALLESDDPKLERWTYRGILHRAPRSRAAFFECPSLSRVDGRHLLTYSAHRPVEYLTGGFDPEAAAFRPEGGGRIDHSPHFYAPTFFAREPGGRPILVGWVRGWGKGRGWNGVLSLPRLVGMGDDGRLRQRPLPGLRRLRGREAQLAPATRLEGETRDVEPLRSRSIEVSAALSLGEGPAAGLRLRRADDDAVVAAVTLVRVGGEDGGASGGRNGGADAGADGGASGGEDAGANAASDGPGARIEARIEARTLSFRLQPGEPPAPSSGAAEPSTVAIPLGGVGPGEPVALHLFWDRSVLEVFLADGRETCTLVVEAAGEALRVEAFARDGAARFETLRAWSLEPIW